MKETKDICAFPDCGKELTHKEGRKKRKYCSPACGRKDWGRRNYKPSDKPKKFKTIPIEQWEEIQKKLAAGKDVDDNRDNALTNAARGRDKSSINEDELKFGKASKKTKKAVSRGKINYQPTTKESFDGEPLHKAIQDEAGQYPTKLTPFQEMLKKKRGF